MTPVYFKALADAEKVCQLYIDEQYPNKFQYKLEDVKIKIVEFKKGFAVQFGDYGPYLEKYNGEVK